VKEVKGYDVDVFLNTKNLSRSLTAYDTKVQRAALRTKL
jgi:hypothetical protein